MGVRGSRAHRAPGATLARRMLGATLARRMFGATPMRRMLGATLACSLAACAQGAQNPLDFGDERDAAVDASGDASLDAHADAAPHDAGSDAHEAATSADAGADAPVDASADAKLDAPADAAADASTDAAADATTDAATDAHGDAPIDALVEAGDAGCSPTSCGAQRACTSAGCVDGRLVFVTSSSSAGNLGGVAGADARCAALASAAGLAGSFGAWIATSASVPSGRLSHASVPYFLVDGTRVADDWADLTDGSIQAPIARDESGFSVSTFEVWTDCDSSGTYGGGGCSDFTSSSSSASFADVGVTSSASYGWSSTYAQYCDRTNVHLYCFEN